MAEHDVPVAQRCAVLGKFLEAEDQRVLWRVDPTAFGRDGAACGVIGLQRDRALAAVFYRHGKAPGHQRLDPFGRQAGAFLIGALLGAQPDMGHSIPIARTALTEARVSIIAAKADSLG